MQIDTNPSVLRHWITNTEIRTVINHPEIRIEVIADILDTDHVEAFHAMMLRPSLVAELALNRFITPEYAPQRR